MSSPPPPARDGTTAGSAVHWLAGEARFQTDVARILAKGLVRTKAVHANPRRTLHEALVRSEPEPGSPALRVAIKTHHLATGRHRLREAAKRAIGRSPAWREWSALEVLHAAGVPVPRPLAYGRLASGDEVVVCEWIDGMPLADAFASAEVAKRDRLVAALARTLESLHVAGLVHGDLHLGNLRVARGTDQVVLLDLQRARRSRGRGDRGRDFASLELSLLRASWPAESRAEVRRRMGLGEEFDALLRRHATDRLRGRARRVLRPGRRLQTVRWGRHRGLRDESVPEAALLNALERAERSGARRSRRGGRSWVVEETAAGRPVVVKWTAGGGFAERLAAVGRGSRAARAFWHGQREQLLLARSARPLAYLEERVGPLTGSSWLVLERVGEVDLDRCQPDSPEQARALAEAFGDWLAELHALGLGHRDLKGSNLRADTGAAGATRAGSGAKAASAPRFWLLDLEDLTGPTTLRDDDRLTALAQLNASLPDEHFDLAAREAALARYVARLAFASPALGIERAKLEIARRSLARRHRWRAEGCSLARDERLRES